MAPHVPPNRPPPSDPPPGDSPAPREKVLRFSTTLLRLKALGRAADADEVLATTLEILGKGLSSPNVHIFVPDPVAKVYRHRNGEGIVPAQTRVMAIPFEEPSLFAILTEPGARSRLGPPLSKEQMVADPSMGAGLQKIPVPVDLLVPLLSPTQELIGFITVGGLGHHADQDDLTLLGTVASLTGSLLHLMTRAPITVPPDSVPQNATPTPAPARSAERKEVRCGRCQGPVFPNEKFCSACGHPLF